jgi:hypothetical protein
MPKKSSTKVPKRKSRNSPRTKSRSRSRSKKSPDVGSVIDLDYLTHLFSEDYFNIKWDRNAFISFEKVTSAVEEDMENQHGDSKVGTEGHKQPVRYDSGHWHKDLKNLKEGDILFDATERSDSRIIEGKRGVVSEYGGEAWLVVKQGGNFGLRMFPRRRDKEFRYIDARNRHGEMIHPITGKIIKVIK